MGSVESSSRQPKTRLAPARQLCRAPFTSKHESLLEIVLRNRSGRTIAYLRARLGLRPRSRDRAGANEAQSHADRNQCAAIQQRLLGLAFELLAKRLPLRIGPRQLPIQWLLADREPPFKASTLRSWRSVKSSAPLPAGRSPLRRHSNRKDSMRQPIRSDQTRERQRCV